MRKNDGIIADVVARGRTLGAFLDFGAGVVGAAVLGELDGRKTERVGTPDDIVNDVLFFAGDQAGWITGQTLSIDGGR